ncbi:MAG TPA: sigma factor, partial [Nannocystaceae bacterium]|nr:sigma factor [Nannocystaceae bacterium]
MDEVVPSDRELYLDWHRGDAGAGGRLVDRHLVGLGRFFANKVFDGRDAEDLVASTFEICARKLGDWTGTGSFRAYIFGVAHNVLR